MDREVHFDTAVIGGGLGGLATAAWLGAQRRKVVLFERSRTLGGRARTQTPGGFAFNQGPHALYRAAAGIAVLRELGIEPRGGTPSTSGAYALHRGGKHALPGGFLSLLTTGLLDVSAKLETARLLSRLPRLQTDAWDNTSLQDWLDANVRHPVVRQLAAALVRLTNYAHAPQTQSAGAALAQLQRGLGEGVLYLDGGWQSLVDALQRVAAERGVEVHSAARVRAVQRTAAGWLVCGADGSACTVDSVVLAVSPQAAAAMVRPEDGGATLADWAAASVPVRAACLDLGLRHLPQPRARFALGVDRPFYFSVHSACAKLAPHGGAVVQIAKYLTSDGADAHAEERELEEVADQIQPGWRAQVSERRFLPEMTVSHAVVDAARGGLAGRPGPAVPGAPGLYVVGDWVGPTGLLADASLASARAAAAAIAHSTGALEPRVAA